MRRRARGTCQTREVLERPRDLEGLLGVITKRAIADTVIDRFDD
jgi:hypothetical protein